jgi:hypothetical protein
MVPAKDNITIYCGSVSTRRYRWVRGTTPVDLTGAVIRAQFRKSIKSPDVVLELSTTNGAVTIDGDGWFRMTFRAAATALADHGEQFRAVGHVTVALAGQDPVRFVEIDALFMPSGVR